MCNYSAQATVFFSADIVQRAHSTRTGAGFPDADGPTLTFVFCTHLHGEMKERQEERESDGSKWKKERESMRRQTKNHSLFNVNADCCEEVSLPFPFWVTQVLLLNEPYEVCGIYPFKRIGSRAHLARIEGFTQPLDKGFKLMKIC